VCGINGILRLRPDAAPISRDELLRTQDHMQARGPRPKTGFSIPVVDWLSTADISKNNPRGFDSRYLAMRVLDGFGIFASPS
jgi:hypothetical protein